MLFRICVAAVAVTIMSATVGVAVLARRDQSPNQDPKGTRRPLPTVASVALLRANSPEDLAVAEFFDRYGSEPIKAGSNTRRGKGMPVPPQSGTVAPDYRGFLASFVCDFDAVVIGSATYERVLINRRETFLFTEYSLAVKDWISPETGPEALKMAVPGAELRLEGRVTRVEGAPQPAVGEALLFFLRRIPGTRALVQAYAPLSPETSFADVVHDKSVPTLLAERSVPFAELVHDLKTAARSCKGGR